MSISVSASGPIEIDSDWPRLIHITWHVKSFKERAVDADRSVQKRRLLMRPSDFTLCGQVGTLGGTQLGHVWTIHIVDGCSSWFVFLVLRWLLRANLVAWIMIITKYDTYMCTASCERILHRRCGDSGFRWFFSCSAGLSKANPMASLVPSQCPMRKPVLPYLGSSSPTLARSEPRGNCVKDKEIVGISESHWIHLNPTSCAIFGSIVPLFQSWSLALHWRALGRTTSAWPHAAAAWVCWGIGAAKTSQLGVPWRRGWIKLHVLSC